MENANDPPRALWRRYWRNIALLCLIVVGASSALDLFFSYRDRLHGIAEIQRAEAGAARARIAEYLSGVDRLLSGALVYLDVEDVAIADKQTELRRLLQQIPSLISLRLLSADGRERLFVSRIELDRTSDGGTTGATEPPPPRSGAVAYGPIHYRDGTAPAFSLNAWSARPSGGALVAEVDLKFVSDAVTQVRFGQTGRAFLCDAEGRVVAHPNLSVVLRKLRLPVPTQAASGSLTAVSWLPGANGYAEEGTATRWAKSLDSGEEVLLSFVPVPGTGWTIYAEQQASEVMQSVKSAFLRALLILCVALAIAFVLARVLARHMSRPILELRAAAARVGSGDLEGRIRLETGDEIQALGAEFNAMADKLRESYSGLEQKVAEKTAELALANRHKSEFLANMSHELRTPLNAVIGFSEALRDEYFGALNGKQKEYVVDIHSSGEHLLSLINEVLDLAKVEAGKMELDAHRFSLRATIDNALTLVRERAVRKRIAISSSVEEGVDEIVADERKVKQVLINLLSNAVKFSDAGGSVRVEARHADGATILTVGDTGPGIAAEDQSRIFEAFQQLPGAGSAKHEGTGLGLSLARSFVELHGGRMWVENEPGHGARFSFSLPDTLPA
jgi:signal transduction histidine kinase